MLSKYAHLGGGVLTILAVFIPYATVLGQGVTMMQAKAGVAYFFIALGVIGVTTGFAGKKLLNILTIITGLAVAGFAFMLMTDERITSVGVGMGLYLLLFGGITTIIASVLGFMKK